MKILITGGSGFIGRNLVEHFSKKFEVLAPTHKELELLDEEVVSAYLNQHKFDVVIHSAIKPGHRNVKDPSKQLYINSRMFFNLVRKSGQFKKMLLLSSGLVYDQRHYKPKMSEDYFDTYVPVDEGGLAKYIAAKYAEKVDNIVELRLFGVFGKYEDYAIRFISNAICKTLFELPITIKQNRKFDYLYIDDLMPIIDYFLGNKGAFKQYNVTPNESIELFVLAQKVRKVSGKDIPIKIAKVGMGIEYSGDNSRLKEELGQIKFTPIDEAISKLYNWYIANKGLINRELLLFDK